uniref:HAT C-terminal dimerisation domain-containing protein n=1 Tax=Monopterus albus TaxID=43700 RepID=A0A3Q3QB42_MONAL
SQRLDMNRIQDHIWKWPRSDMKTSDLVCSHFSEESRPDAAILPRNALDVLNACNQHFFPNVFKLIQILVTPPVTTAHVERSFSRLGRIKDLRRSTMSESRLNGLTLLSEHRDIKVMPDEVLDIFTKIKSAQTVENGSVKV